MRECSKFYIGGEWVDPLGGRLAAVVNPATEAVSGGVALGGAQDVDRAVAAARRAFGNWSQSSRSERLDLLASIAAAYDARSPDLADAITEEMGAPAALAGGFQVGLGAGHIATAIEILRSFPFEEQTGATMIAREPIGVCGLITPWNWPMSLTTVKVIPALATGCTMILKPSEIAPYSGQVFAEILDEAGVPAGVFNLVQGDGAGVGSAMSGHAGIDMISFTGSTRAGVEIARNGAATVKRISQELGGKSANILLDDTDLAPGVARGVAAMMGNSGQTCSAPSRMLVPMARMDEAVSAARQAVADVTVGDPRGNHVIGPVASKAQFDKVQAIIRDAVAGGVELIAGGEGRPEGLETGYYVRPTIFARVTNDQAIARDEVFGPVLVIIGYNDIDHAVEIANDSEYGLAGFVSGIDIDAARAVARRIRAGWISINDGFDFMAPFGGYKKSGNGREWGAFGFHEYLETKAILGFGISMI